MSDELAQFLNEPEGSTDEPVTEPTVAETPAEPEPATTEPVPDGSTSEPVKTEKESGHVPLAARLDEREKRQK